MKNKKFIVLIILIIVMGISISVYLNTAYEADEEALGALETTDTIEVSELSDGSIVFTPENIDAGLIFYPGGKVEHEAYAKLMRKCAENNMKCFLVKMPFNLAIFDVSAAQDIREMHPDIEEWYIGGHSLGGAMAASYVSEHVDEYEGLWLLASYSTADLMDADIAVVSVYGTEDGVINMEKYLQYENNFPTDTQEVIVNGGCHSFFGNYGIQDGDGEAFISSDEQQNIAVEALINMID